MPPISVDLTINIATLLGVATLVWRASAVVAELRSVRSDLDEHTRREEKNFEEWRNRFAEHSTHIHVLDTRTVALETKVDQIARKGAL